MRLIDSFSSLTRWANIYSKASILEEKKTVRSFDSVMVVMPMRVNYHLECVVVVVVDKLDDRPRRLINCVTHFTFGSEWMKTQERLQVVKRELQLEASNNCHQGSRPHIPNFCFCAKALQVVQLVRDKVSEQTKTFVVGRDSFRDEVTLQAHFYGESNTWNDKLLRKDCAPLKRDRGTAKRQVRRRAGFMNHRVERHGF